METSQERRTAWEIKFHNVRINMAELSEVARRMTGKWLNRRPTCFALTAGDFEPAGTIDMRWSAGCQTTNQRQPTPCSGQFYRAQSGKPVRQSPLNKINLEEAIPSCLYSIAGNQERTIGLTGRRTDSVRTRIPLRGRKRLSQGDGSVAKDCAEIIWHFVPSMGSVPSVAGRVEGVAPFRQDVVLSDVEFGHLLVSDSYTGQITFCVQTHLDLEAPSGCYRQLRNPVIGAQQLSRGWLSKRSAKAA